MRRITVGLLAHVDAGKTTLSEAMLYHSGALRKLGRVDHQDAFLDTDDLERQRGITIFSKMAQMQLDDLSVTLLDTPGHVDFSAEMERTLQVLDAAILVISATDGIQGHTRTLLKLLDNWNIPTFIFVNKMDLAGADRQKVLQELQSWNSGCIDMQLSEEAFAEQAAMASEELLNEYLENASVSEANLRAAIADRKLFPVIFGAALKLDGIDELLNILKTYLPQPVYPDAFGAKVFKVTRDSQNARLTWLKVTGGILHVKDLVSSQNPEAPQEKADQLRLYSGEKFTLLDQAPAGTICAVIGLHAKAGDGLGEEPDSPSPLLQPVLSSRIILEEGTDAHKAYLTLLPLEEEDPSLHLEWNEHHQEIHLQLMGPVQLEILSSKISERFGMNVSFEKAGILYRETITDTVEGVGHFEPLRHYAEVHLLLEPGKRGSGLTLATACSLDVLDLNWQRLVMTHLLERVHRGVLTGSPLTDVKITLLTGRAHEKHTEGGDFRQATYRAVRQGLMHAHSILLEPYYAFTIEVPQNCLGRALSDLSMMDAVSDPPKMNDDLTILTGRAPVSKMQNYAAELASYTKGIGRISCIPDGFDECKEPDTIISAIGYDALRDTDQPADSVFCSHGSGFVVPWNEVPSYMHLGAYKTGSGPIEEPAVPKAPVRKAAPKSSLEQDKELLAIYEQTYGKIQRRNPLESVRKKPEREVSHVEIRTKAIKDDYLLVDGYNVIHAWDELKVFTDGHLDAARSLLIELLVNYQAYRKNKVILVFDAYKVKGGTEHVDREGGLFVVYTKEAETADTYIERTTLELSKKDNAQIRVATSDGPEQVIILGHGALRITPSNLHDEVEQARGRISALINQINQKKMNRPILESLQKAQEKKENNKKDS